MFLFLKIVLAFRGRLVYVWFMNNKNSGQQVTHVVDPESGRLQQIVTPAQLRKILRAQGESLARPADFRPYDEWFV